MLLFHDYQSAYVYLFRKCRSGELGEEEKKNDSELTADDLQSLEMLLGLVCRLVHLTATTGEGVDSFPSISSFHVCTFRLSFRFHRSVLRCDLCPGLFNVNPFAVFG